MAVSLVKARPGRPMKHMMIAPRTVAAQAIQKHIGQPQTVELHWATVASIQAGPPKSLTLNIDGSSNTTPGVRYLASYTPTVGDTVLLLKASGHNRHSAGGGPQKASKQASDTVCIGKLA